MSNLSIPYSIQVDKNTFIGFGYGNPYEKLHILGIDGKELPDANAGNIIAQALANDTDGDCLKYWEWALKLNKGESIDLDISDKEKLSTFVKNHKGLPNLTKAQVLLAFSVKK